MSHNSPSLTTQYHESVRLEPHHNSREEQSSAYSQNILSELKNRGGGPADRGIASSSLLMDLENGHNMVYTDRRRRNQTRPSFNHVIPKTHQRQRARPSAVLSIQEGTTASRVKKMRISQRVEWSMPARGTGSSERAAGSSETAPEEGRKKEARPRFPHLCPWAWL